MRDRRSSDPLEDLRGVVAARLPGYQADAVLVLGEGLDSVVYQVGGELLVRCGKQPDRIRRAGQVRREARLLAAVAAISPLPVPEPLFTVPERGWLAYRKLPGVPLIDVAAPGQLQASHVTAVAARLGELLAALHGAPIDQMAALVGIDDQPLVEWHQEAAETYTRVIDAVPTAHRRAVSVPPSTPDAACWRTWPTASKPGGASTSARASPRWRGCSHPKASGTRWLAGERVPRVLGLGLQSAR